MRPASSEPAGTSSVTGSGASSEPTDRETPGTAQVQARSNLLPEESAGAGSDDPHAQAKIILEDSERRTEQPDAAPTTFVEHRASDEIT